MNTVDYFKQNFKTDLGITHVFVSLVGMFPIGTTGLCALAKREALTPKPRILSQMSYSNPIKSECC